MLPETKELPSGILEDLRLAEIAPTIRLEFGIPEGLVRFRPSGMNRAPMPKATINLDGDPRLGEADVDPASPRDRVIDPEPVTPMMQNPPNDNLRIGISSPDPGHDLGARQPPLASHPYRNWKHPLYISSTRLLKVSSQFGTPHRFQAALWPAACWGAASEWRHRATVSSCHSG